MGVRRVMLSRPHPTSSSVSSEFLSHTRSRLIAISRHSQVSTTQLDTAVLADPQTLRPTPEHHTTRAVDFNWLSPVAG